VPLPTVRRLPGYLLFLKSLKARGREVVSCTHIADELDLTSIQVRKDLAVTGIVGKPRIGYAVNELIDAVEDFLGWKNTSDAFLVGAGSLGSALLGYGGFQDAGLNLVAAFDVDPSKIGTQIHGREVLALDRLHDLASRMHVLIGVLTVPAAAAQDAATQMVMAGMRAIWNYTPVTLEVPEGVIVEDVKLTASLAVLSSRLADLLRGETTRRRKPATSLT
jgi:redox-sensing transcriptional repressor